MPNNQIIAEQLQTAIGLHKSGRFAEAQALYERILRSNPRHADALHLLGVIASQQQQFSKAVELIGKAIAAHPTSAPFYSNRGLALKELRKFDAALSDYNKALSLNPAYAEAFYNRGLVFSALHKFESALADYDKAISFKPAYAEAFNNRGLAQQELGKLEASIVDYGKAIVFRPNFAEAYANRGAALKALNKLDSALIDYDKAIAIKPDYADAYFNRANVLQGLKKFEAAIVSYEKAVSLKPQFPEAYINLGDVFAGLKDRDKALAAYDKALSLNPNLEGAWFGRGNVFHDLKSYDEAFAAYDKALSIKPDLADAWLGRGNVLHELKRFDEAVAAYDKALSIKPDLEGVEGGRLHGKMQLCDWDNLDDDIASLTASVRDGKANCSPFALLALTDSPDDHLRCAQAWVTAKFPQVPESPRREFSAPHDKIRIGYVSTDFRNHPVALLFAELPELHDRSKFEITAFSVGPNDNAGMRRRLEKSFDRFIDCEKRPDAEVISTISALEIDVLVDLSGLTQFARPGVFAHRPAPIQVNYLGYPGTMGAPYIDYIIGDHSLFTSADADVYSEKLVRLPHSYQPNDRKRPIADKHFGREDFGLPKDRVVFCCFNNSYKILPNVFARWMRILKAVDGSVLWLLADNQTTIANLRKEAIKNGVEAHRLIFANKIDLPDHLARHRLADLVLDTLPYNAHTTASDALWAGLPVLTQVGNTFAGRVAASLLNAAGLPELIAYSTEQYEALAVDLARTPEKLKGIKVQLAANRQTAPLFDSPLYTKHLEAAFEAMYQRHKAGLPPEHIEIKAGV